MGGECGPAPAPGTYRQRAAAGTPAINPVRMDRERGPACVSGAHHRRPAAGLAAGTAPAAPARAASARVLAFRSRARTDRPVLFGARGRTRIAAAQSRG